MFRCWVEDGPFAAIVHVQGEVDLLTAPEFRQCVHATARRNTGKGWVAIDLTELEYLDSRGFLTLEEGRRLCHQHHRELVLVAPPPHVERILKLLKLTELLPVLNSVEALAGRMLSHADGDGDGHRKLDVRILPPDPEPRRERVHESRGRQTS